METKENLGVTIDNAIQYVEAIEKAVKDGIGRISKDQRALYGFAFCDTLRMVENSIEDFTIKKIEKGEIPPPSPEQVKKLIRQVKLVVEPKKYN